MSSINTALIDVNYPVPGVNNSSQGFRDNFSGIKNNLDIAALEIQELQNKSIFKSALEGTTLDNDMSNALISNALTQGFRLTTFNLGNNLTGKITVDVTRGDVQYGTVTGNITLNFTKWAPIGTQAKVQLILTVPSAYASSTIQLPNQVDSSKLTIENFNSVNNTITTPNGVTELHYVLTTEDCGTTLTIEQVNRPRKTTQLVTTIPTSSIGSKGDRPGAIAADSTYVYVCVGIYDGTSSIWKRIQLSTW